MRGRSAPSTEYVPHCRPTRPSASQGCRVLGWPDRRVTLRRRRTARQGHNHAVARGAGSGSWPKAWNDALKKIAGLLLKLQFLKGQQRLPARRLIDPAPSAFTRGAFRHRRILRPGEATGVAVVVRRSWSEL